MYHPSLIIFIGDGICVDLLCIYRYQPVRVQVIYLWLNISCITNHYTVLFICTSQVTHSCLKQMVLQLA